MFSCSNQTIFILVDHVAEATPSTSMVAKAFFSMGELQQAEKQSVRTWEQQTNEGVGRRQARSECTVATPDANPPISSCRQDSSLHSSETHAHLQCGPSP